MPIATAFSSSAAIAGALASLLTCFFIILTKSWHGRVTLDGTTGVQKFHTAPTPRVGGVGIVIGMFVALGQLSGGVAEIFRPMLLAGTVAFLFGLAEDVTRRISVRDRLLATIASGLLAWWITGVRLTSVHIWGIDQLLAIVPVSVVFTAVAAGGVANAVNIIDGFNGLAGGVILISLAAMGAIAWSVGDSDLAVVCVLLGAVTIGFLIVNFPFGKIFLGDGGAYLLGFMLAWIAVLLAQRNPAVSPWAALMACCYPILEVLFSIARRSRRHANPGHPDRLHLHSLIRCRITRKQFSNWPAVLKNSAVAPIVWVMASVPALMAVLFRESTPVLVGLFVLCAWSYGRIYRRLVRFSW